MKPVPVYTSRANKHICHSNNPYKTYLDYFVTCGFAQQKYPIYMLTTRHTAMRCELAGQQFLELSINQALNLSATVA